MLEPLYEHLAGSGVELDLAPPRAADVGSGYAESFRLQYFQGDTAIQGSHGRFAAVAVGDRQDIAAAEHFHLYFLAHGAQRVELSGQIADAVVDITAALIGASGAPLRPGMPRQNAVA